MCLANSQPFLGSTDIIFCKIAISGIPAPGVFAELSSTPIINFEHFGNSALLPPFFRSSLITLLLEEKQ
jgi:hypothetical protein